MPQAANYKLASAGCVNAIHRTSRTARVHGQPKPGGGGRLPRLLLVKPDRMGDEHFQRIKFQTEILPRRITPYCPFAPPTATTKL